MAGSEFPMRRVKATILAVCSTWFFGQAALAEKHVVREAQLDKRDRPERSKVEAERPKPRATGQIFCGNAGCRPVEKGCRIETSAVAGTGVAGTSLLRKICN
jgi:hypothetical protein